jgi:hypothetical protein
MRVLELADVPGPVVAGSMSMAGVEMRLIGRPCSRANFSRK